MTNSVIPKTSDEPGLVPLPADLEPGELALNTADGIVYTKTAAGNIIIVGGDAPSQFTTEPPTAGTEGDLWFDTDNGNKMYRWDGVAWVSVRDAGIDQAISDAADAQDTADGKIESFYQSEAPIFGMSLGDLWFDEDDSNKVYRFNGISWEDAKDSDIALAINDASNAQSTADGKVTTFFTATTPPAEAIGDLWFNSSDGNKLYRWNGAMWEDAHDFAVDQAITNASNAQSTADGKINSFYQNTAPTVGIFEGDLWIDTNDGNKLYIYESSAWVNRQDSLIGNALVDASTAQATADGKVTTFFDISAPVAEADGDLWFDTDDGNKLYRWNGASWISARDTDIAQAISDAATSQSTADGKIESFYQTTAPLAGMSEGDLWFDTANGNRIYRYTSTSWVSAVDSEIGTALNSAATAQSTADGKVTTFFQTSSPTAEGTGDLWIDTDNENKMHRWSGSSWVSARDESITQALNAASTAQSTADGKIESFYQTSAPVSGMAEGDLWFDTDNGNKIYRYSGSSWIAAQDSGIAQAVSDAATAISTADGKVTTFFTTSTPTATATGDLWYSSSTALLKRWSGSSWITVSNSFSNTTQITDGANLGGTSTWGGVTGVGKPADNADSTNDVMTAGIDLTAGYLQNGSTLKLDFANKALTINDDTFGNAGIQQQYNSGSPRFYVGNGNRQFFKYEGNEISLGRDTQLLGASSFNNTNIYIDGHMSDLAYDEQVHAGGGNVNKHVNGWVNLSTTGTSGHFAKIWIRRQYMLYSNTWFKPRGFSIAGKYPSSTTNVDTYFYTGDIIGNGSGFGFKLTANGSFSTLYSITNNNGSKTTSQMTNFTKNGTFRLTAVLTPSQDVKFYKEGFQWGSGGTITTNLPNNFDSLYDLFTAYQITTSNGVGANIAVGQFKFIQE